MMPNTGAHLSFKDGKESKDEDVRQFEATGPPLLEYRIRQRNQWSHATLENMIDWKAHEAAMKCFK